MNRSIQELVDRNADACERAKTSRCRCHCGGALHGMRHDEDWRARTAQEIEEAHGRKRAFELAQLALALEGKRDDDDVPEPYGSGEPGVE